MKQLLPICLVALASGCGPDKRDVTLSILNVEADRWDGGKAFDTTATDAYGRPVVAQIEKGSVYYHLELRSHGPDGLPMTHDDIVVQRRRPHGGAKPEVAPPAKTGTDGPRKELLGEKR